MEDLRQIQQKVNLAGREAHPNRKILSVVVMIPAVCSHIKPT